MSPIKLILLTLMLAPLSAAAGLRFSGLSLQPVEDTPAAATGLKAIYVLPTIDGVTAQFEGAGAISWERFSALGGGYAEPVESTQSGNVSTLAKLEGNMGYILTDGNGKKECFWIVDWSTYDIALRDLMVNSASDCSTTWLDVDGHGDAITCYGINGAPIHLDRGFALTYSTLEFSEEEFAWVQTDHTETLAALEERIYCTPPLCQTTFTLEGDRFAREWGLAQEVTSETYDPTAVDARSRALQTEREDADNEVSDEGSSSGLGGSAPAEVTFTAAVTDAAIFHEWEMARDPEFADVVMRFTDLEFVHTFTEEGTRYVRLRAANAEGACEYIGDTFEVTIGASSLKAPNAFSPGASEGVNDEWKVSYKSIVEFDCHIFDRAGRRLAHLTHPSQGWDGKIRGKVAPAGVYFYVIRAKGADGVDYKLSGDINIVGFKQADTTTSNETE